jgi:hypothetical protein
MGTFAAPCVFLPIGKNSRCYSENLRVRASLFHPWPSNASPQTISVFRCINRRTGSTHCLSRGTGVVLRVQICQLTTSQETPPEFHDCDLMRVSEPVESIVRLLNNACSQWKFREALPAASASDLRVGAPFMTCACLPQRRMTLPKR